MSLSFTQTTSIKKAVDVINNVNPNKFPLVLSRIIQKLHLKDERTFTEDEEKKLETALSLNESDLQLLIETCEFFLQQAAYHTSKPAVLQSQLEQLGLTEDKVSAIVTTWQNGAKEVLERLRHRMLSPKQLDSVKWKLSLVMGSSTKAKTKLPVATLELGMKNENTDNDNLQMEFTHEELYKFYDQLETIQSQIDSLS
ncbi:hypothetical protein LSH36_315g03082 [Paralvinella palmiformis]|uniref:COMM domain-containing protein n=1 Tax=Paralvinella palmiformis TaxID=53620 RepID=A0AAD9JI92_9ANNE|nr:hypothetical protein LSH36_315g03082 [Paralvinella palmiformis]